MKTGCSVGPYPHGNLSGKPQRKTLHSVLTCYTVDQVRFSLSSAVLRYLHKRLVQHGVIYKTIPFVKISSSGMQRENEKYSSTWSIWWLIDNLFVEIVVAFGARRMKTKEVFNV